ncbi:unnamed protein product [Eruca vesicaria subsp. sativa]|uniref:PRONE domain-containing protein n=1 Tax=Eruca vesicaria subsp. sativa TaxID=29727 RepID=A0ABC8JZ58_ERUVS|nr:unnamed protein product [Eruca vesicaria subsp. sativa]
MAKLLLGEDMSDKWWLLLPRVPSDGLSEQSRKKLDHTHNLTNQILKACMSIKNSALAEIEVPQAYFEALPKNVSPCLGDFLYRSITSDNFSADYLLGIHWRKTLLGGMIVKEMVNQMKQFAAKDSSRERA